MVPPVQPVPMAQMAHKASKVKSVLPGLRVSMEP